MTRLSRRIEAKNWAKKHGGNFNLGASVKRLKEIKDEAPFYPLEKLSKYADGVAKNTANDYLLHKPGMDEVKAMSDAEIYHSANTTAYGNIAFIILNTNYPDLKEDGLQFINRMRSYIKFIGKEPENLNADGELITDV